MNLKIAKWTNGDGSEATGQKFTKGKKDQITKTLKNVYHQTQYSSSTFSHINRFNSVTITYLILFLTNKYKFSFIIFFFCLNLQ